jgi:hypothetical protein
MRYAFAMMVVFASGCRIGEYVAPPPVDSGPDGVGVIVDAPAPPDGPPAFHGMHATIGENPGWTGSCDALDTRAEMLDRFDPAVQEQDVRAGWDFDTSADIYNDATFNFDPNWPTAASGQFSVRFAGTIALAAGPHCFSIDVGATGTDIVGGKNECAQIYLGDGDAIAETGYLAATSGVATGCIDLGADAAPELDIIFWYFNIFEQATLHVRTCDGAACIPSTPLPLSALTPVP